MKVICAGYPKTGTKSICRALRILGFNVFDFEEQIWLIGKEMKKAMEDGLSLEELREAFKGVDATTDMPASALWENLLEAYPNAKVKRFIFIH